MNEGSEIRSEALGSENLTKGDGPGIVKAVVSLAAEETRTAINASPRLGSFFSSVSGYFSACRHVQSLDEWMRLNKQRFGSEILYADEVAGGWIIGYAAGVSVKHALKIGLLLVGAGYVAVQTMSYYGLLTVHWRKVDEVVRGPMDAVGNAKLSDENTKALKLRIKQFLERSAPCTTGFGVGLAWGFLKG